MAGDEVVDRRAAAAIGHLLELDAGDLGEPLHDHVLRRALAAARRIAQARLLFHQRHELVQRVDAQRGMHRQHHGLARQLDDGHEILQRIVADLVDVRVAGNRIAVTRTV